MSVSGGSEDEDCNSALCVSTRKRKHYGRVSDAAKKIRNHSFETGQACNCKKHKCFEILTDDQKRNIINRFNLMSDRNEQNSYLCGLISILDIKRRRPRNEEGTANLRDNSFTYKIRVLQADGSFREISVCQTAFINLHGITNRRLITLKRYLKECGKSCHDRRGTHQNRPHQISEETLEIVRGHIRSFKGRKSHYSLKDTRRIYLPETLTVKKMHQMYLDNKYPHKPISYESYRNIFLKDFNIGFGYPRSDTCSTCDATVVKIESLDAQIKSTATLETEKVALLKKKLKQVTTEDKLHKLKAQAFYTRKRLDKRRARKHKDYEAITMDFCKNLPTPNITTNDVYYKRQLTFVSFNVHVLSSNQSVFYTYPQTVAKKGADDVMSMLYNFCFEILNPEVKHLTIFCDSCAGQNKNYTLIRFLHYLVHARKRFNSIKVVFPVRGHSYLESDKDFGLINQRTKVEVPEQWNEVFQAARAKPQPFEVRKCNQDLFCAWSKFLQKFYRKTCPFATRPVRELQFSEDHPCTIAVRETAYNAAPTTFVIAARNVKFDSDSSPDALYSTLIPLPKKKYDQLQELKRFVAEEFQQYYEELPSIENDQSDDEFDVS